MLVPILCERCVVCVCVRAHVLACMHAYVCACMHLCMCVGLSVCTCTCTCVCVYTYVRVCTYAYIYMYVCGCTCMSVLSGVVALLSPKRLYVVGLVLKSCMFTLKINHIQSDPFTCIFKMMCWYYTLNCQKYGYQFCGQKWYIFFGLQLLYCQCDGVLCVKMLFCNQTYNHRISTFEYYGRSDPFWAFNIIY